MSEEQQPATILTAALLTGMRPSPQLFMLESRDNIHVYARAPLGAEAATVEQQALKTSTSKDTTGFKKAAILASICDEAGAPAFTKESLEEAYKTADSRVLDELADIAMRMCGYRQPDDDKEEPDPN